MEIKRKKCIFCLNGKSFKAKEHVFAQWILEELNFRNIVRPFNETQVQKNGSQLDFSRTLQNHKNYGNYVSPYVCDECNHGWMSRLEDRIKPILLPLIHGSSSLYVLLKEEKILIARWAVKTACVIESANRPTDGIYIAADPSKIRTNCNLPPGWAVFATTHAASVPLGFLSNDFWWVEGNVPNELKENLKKFRRIVIQIKNLILVAVFIGDARLKLKAVKSFHFPININLDIEWVFRSTAPYYTFQNVGDQSTENIINEFCGGLSLQVL